MPPVILSSAGRIVMTLADAKDQSTSAAGAAETGGGAACVAMPAAGSTAMATPLQKALGQFHTCCVAAPPVCPTGLPLAS